MCVYMEKKIPLNNCKYCIKSCTFKKQKEYVYTYHAVWPRRFRYLPVVTVIVIRVYIMYVCILMFLSNLPSRAVRRFACSSSSSSSRPSSSS